MPIHVNTFRIKIKYTLCQKIISVLLRYFEFKLHNYSFHQIEGKQNEENSLLKISITFSLQYAINFFLPFNKLYISLKNKTNLIDWYYFCLLTENQDNKMPKK